MKVENFSLSKFPQKGKCKKSTFACGWHRIGIVPVESLLDGGLPGDSCQEICLDCGKVFKNKWFKPINQPNKLTQQKEAGDE